MYILRRFENRQHQKLILIMGGGDLNLKKSWHPNTMKNQEMVWKAEKAAAEEQRKIAELQKEREMEHNRIELNTLAKQTAGVKEDGRLSWMYDKPDKKANHEEYLLGKAVDGSFDQPDKEHASISAMSRRVAGSSMLIASAGEGQVDLARKMREDPLLLVKERERSARLALLNNPLQRKKLAELLRQEQMQKDTKKVKKLKKKKSELDDKLAKKLNALGGKKNLDLAALLASGDSSSSDSDSGSTKKSKKKKKEKKAKKSKKKKRKLERSLSESSLDEIVSKKYKHTAAPEKNLAKNISVNDYSDLINKSSRHEQNTSSKYGNSSAPSSKRDSNYIKDRRASSKSRYSPPPPRQRKEPSRSDNAYTSDSKQQSFKPYKSQGRDRTDGDRYKNQSQMRSSPVGGRKSSPYDRQRKGLSAEEKAARLAEMAQAGAEREHQRGVRVAQQRAAIAQEERHATSHSARSGKDARALPHSLESRIHSNRHNIQRSDRHMSEHFARRH